MTQDAPLLSIRDLRIESTAPEVDRPIIRDVSLTLQPGEVLGLIGESGAGKSTLGLAAMGYARDGCRITRGEVLFKGQDLMRLNEAERTALRGQRIAYVAQSAAASFNPAHRLMDQITETAVQMAGLPRKEAETRAVDLFRRMHLPAPDTIGRRYPHQVSGGQLQRLMTAMAMISQPDLIIFDEPTTALDVTTQIGVLASIREVIRDFGTSALYITHDLALVAQMADRIKVLRHGEEVEEAPTAQMLSHPRAEYTRSLWAVRRFRKEPDDRPPGKTPLLELRGVNASYGSKQVLHDIDLSLLPRQTLAVVGESGSGKSTTAQVITGLLPHEGQVLFENAPLSSDLKGRSREQMRDLQIIFQMADTALNPRQSVRDIIGRPLEFFLGLKGRRKEERIREALDLIEMEPDRFIDRLPEELSGGQKQRVAIARALASEPRLVICDEVTSALDQLVAEEILRLLDRTRRQLDLSYIFISHDLATVRAIADDVVVMHNGKIVERGPTEQVFAAPQDDYTARLLASIPEMDPTWLTRRLG